MKWYPHIHRIFTLLFFNSVTAIEITEFYPFGIIHGDNQLHKNDDGSSPVVPISSLFPFFNNKHDSLFVNTNGVISFQQAVSQYTSQPFPLSDGRRLITPFWCDIDTRYGGDIWYRESTDSELLRNVTQEIQLYYPSLIHFHATWIFIVTWDNVPFFGASGVSLEMRNTFQAVLSTNGQHSFTIFNYQKITWTRTAQVGFNGGDGINYYAVPQSRTSDIIQLPQLSNVQTPGKFVFRVDTATIEQGGCNTKGTLTVAPRYIPMFGGKLITVSGPCIDSNDTVKIRFDSGTPNLCVRMSSFSVQCSTPIFYKTGDIKVDMIVSRADQTISLLTGIITSLNPARTTPDLIRTNPQDWKRHNQVRLYWDSQRIPFDVTSASLEVWSVYDNPNNGDGMPQLQFYKTIQRFDDPPYSSFEIDFDAISVVLRMSSTNQEGLIQSIWSDVFFVPPETPAMNIDLCNLWQQSDDSLSDVTQQIVQDCPCTVDQAVVDLVRFHDDPNCHLLTNDVRENTNCAFHPEAERCFYINVPGPQNTGRICCYNELGSLMDVRWRNGGGSLHRRHYLGGPNNVPYLSHFLSDVAPYLECCIHGDSNSCQQYLQRRPQGNCENYRPVRFGRTSGDPHFTTLDGLSYTFNGVGEFVLLRTNNKSFEAQIRMEQAKDANGNLKQAALITSFVAKSYNISDTIEIQLNAIRAADVFVNGLQIDFTETNVHEFTEATVSSMNGSNGSLKKYDIVFKQPSIAFRVLVYPTLLNTFITSGADYFQDNMLGFLGNYNGDPSDDLRTPSGSYVPANSSTHVVHREFGLKWRINESDSLFTYPPGKNYFSYQDVNFTPVFTVSPASTEAKQVCGEDTFCLYDFQVTGDNDIASSTRDTTIIFNGFIQKAKEVKSCGFPVTIRNGSWNYTGVTVNSTANLACEEGFTPSVINQITCMEEGNWTESNVTCEVVSCGQPSEVNNGTWMTSGLVYNSTGTLKCDVGYATNTSGTIHCLSNGLWSTIDTHFCSVSCGQPNAVMRGTWMTTGLVYNSTGTLKCDSGYTTSASGTIRCLGNGSWSDTDPHFCIKSCGYPISIGNGSWNVTGITINSTASIACDKGFIPSLIDELNCMSDGNWSDSNVTCEAVSCGQPTAAKHGAWMTTGLVYNSTGTLKCDAGYTSNTLGTIHCLSNGSWSANSTYFCLKSCDYPGSIENGNWNVTGITVNSTASIACDKGFNATLKDKLTCMSDGNWSDSNVTCEAVSCGQPTATKHGTWKTTGLVYNSTGTLKCDVGYTANTSGTIHCLSNGSWSISGTQCYIKSCDHPASTDNGRWNVTGITVNSTSSIVCDKGYTSSTIDELTCMSDGNWSDSNVTCEAVSCGQPTTAKHGIWKTNGLVFNSTGTLKCDAGYTANTSATIHCLSNGSWSANDVHFCLKSCDYPASIENGSWNVTGITVNFTASIACDKGFTPSVKDQLTCMSDGNWSDSNVTCEAVSCGLPTAAKHGIWMTTGLVYNSTGTLKCDAGYTANTSATIHCLSNGSWSANDAHFCLKSCDYPASIEDGSWNVTGITVNSTASIACDKGFTPSVKDELTCMSDGNWSDSNVTCEAVSCGLPTAAKHGTWITTGLVYNSTGTLKCDTGYTSNTSEAIRCLSNGSWSNFGTLCSLKSCDYPASIGNGRWNDTGITVNSTASIVCDKGYTPSIIDELTCLSDGNWSDSNITCEAVSCGQPTASKHGTWITNGLVYNSTGTLKCDAGYTTNTSVTIHCLSNGSWSNSGTQCSLKSCDYPKSIENGSWNVTGITVNSTASIVCDKGYTSSILDELNCLSNGNWSDSNITCEAVSCGQPTATKHGTWITTGLVYNSTGTLKCDAGYTTNTSATVHCLSNGSWSNSGTLCSIKSCDHPSSIDNGRWNVTGITVNSTASIACDKGYNPSIMDELTCMSDGNWSASNVTCEAVSCGQPTAKKHGTWITTGLVYNSTGTLKCDAGYTTNTSAAIHCLSNGSWSNFGTLCSMKSCDYPPSINNGRWNVTGITVNSTASITCDKGFTAYIIDELTCMSDGNWSDSNVTCEAVSCGQPSPAKHGTWITTGLVNNSTGTLKCDPGYTTNTSPAIHCLSNGSWSNFGTLCSMKSCDYPPSINNGRWNVTGITVNSTASIVCDKGYTPSMIDELTCLSDGNWSDSNVTCEAVSCGLPTAAKHGTWITTGLVYNSTGTLKCDAGYTANTSATIHCLSNGSWSNSGTLCSIKSCDYPPSINNGRWNVTGFTVNFTASITCDKGYTPPIIDELTCMSDGNWSASNVTCEAVSCGLPTAAKHGTWKTTGLVYNSTGTLKCDVGYTANTSATIHCLSNGSWSNSGAQCYMKSCDHPASLKNGSWNVTGVTVNSTASIVCDKGFTHSTIDQLTCMLDGNWSDSNVTCGAVSCGQPTAMKHGTWKTSGLVYNSTGTLTCDTGYTSNTSGIIHCLSNGSWSSSGTQCSIKSCGFPVSIENGSWNVTGVTVNSTAVMLCNEGFTASTTLQKTCLTDGNWTHSNVTCEVVSCGKPTEAKHGIWMTTGLVYNSTGILKCDAGYTANTSATIHCLSNGSWSISDKQCFMKSCDTPASIKNGSWNIRGVTVNSTAILTCDKGFTASTLGQLTCMADGNWTDSNVTCEVVDCGKPNKVLHGSWDFTTTTFESMAMLKCSNGFHFSGNRNVTCLASGQWNVAGAECKKDDKQTRVISALLASSVSVACVIMGVVVGIISVKILNKRKASIPVKKSNPYWRHGDYHRDEIFLPR